MITGDSVFSIPDSWASILPVTGSSLPIQAKLPGFGSSEREKVPPVSFELEYAPFLTGPLEKGLPQMELGGGHGPSGTALT